MSATAQFDPKLVELAKTDTEAFAQLYDFFFPKIYAFVLAKVGEVELAEDLVSEVFMKILNGLEKYQDRGTPFAAWVFTIARNCVFSHFSKNKHQQHSSLDESFEIKDEQNESPLEASKSVELKEKVREIMKNLPERELSILQLKFFSGLNNREIAKCLKLTESNVGIILYRVLKKIKPDLNNLI